MTLPISRIRIFAGTIALALLLLSALAARSQSLTWLSISGVPGCITVKEGAGGKLFSASDGRAGFNAVFYSSLDDGQTWYPTSITYGWIFEVVTNMEHIIVSRATAGGQLPFQAFQSDDNGVTWRGILAAANGFYASSGFMYSDLGNIFAVAGFNNSTLLLKLNGQRWDLIGAQIPQVSFRSVNFPQQPQLTPAPTAIDHDERIYVGTVSNGLYITSNRGSAWTQSLPGLHVTAVAVRSPQEIVVGTSPNATRNGGVFTSADTGRTWTFLGLANEHITSISIGDAGEIHAATSTGVFHYSGTPGNWDNISPSTEPYGGVLLSHSHSIFAAAITKGVFRSSDSGESWGRSGIPKEDIASLLLPGDGSVVAGSLGNRVFVSTNTGGTWGQTFPGEICDNVYTFLEAPPRILAGTDCGIYSSTDGGRLWEDVSQTQFTGGAFGLAGNGQGKIFAGTNFGVHASTDNGTTWTSSGLSAYKITSVVVNGADECFALSGANGVFVSTDGGTTWTSAGLARSDLQTIAANGLNVYVGAGGGIYASTDKGGTWTFSPVVDAFVYSLAFTNASTIVAGTGGGIYVSIDGGISWVQRNTGLSQGIILSVAVDPQGYLYAGALHGGVYKSTQILTGVEEKQRSAVSFGLMQNYPNPFNPVTVIRYSVPVGQSFLTVNPVSLRVYDMLGQIVATLVDGPKAPGEYSAQWDATNAPSGMYFYRLVAGSFSDVRKMIYLK